MKKLTALRALAVFCCLPLVAQAKRPMTFEDMFTAERISDLSLSPDGTALLFRVKVGDLETNGYQSAIHLLDIPSGKVTAMTAGVEKAAAPVWRPDGKAFAYTSKGQIWMKTLDGAAVRQVTDEANGAAQPVFSADGKHLLFTGVHMLEQDKDHDGKVLEKLLFRQWNSWVDGHRQHVYLVPADGEKNPSRDLTPGLHDSPPLDLGTSMDYGFSPDGREVAVVMNTDEQVAVSTNNDIFTVDLASGELTRITSNKGGDAGPTYAPSGRYIAYLSMARAGFEADQLVVTVYDRVGKTHRHLTKDQPWSAYSLTWSPDSKTIYVTAKIKGDKSIFAVGLNGDVTRLTEGGTDTEVVVSPEGKFLYFTRDTTVAPREIYQLDLATKKTRRLTGLNDAVFSQLDMNPWESFWFDSPHGDPVQGFVIKPPNFDEKRKYPMVYLIHGGPQGMWGDTFHYRWNAQLFAAPGYVVVMVNPHGSKGYGQKFCDAVTGDWGGLPYEDLMKGVEVAADRYPFIDKDRMSAAGASYGGYMIAWIATHENPFKSLICHNGVYNLPAMSTSTEELWFVNWEFGGPYYEKPELYDKWSPHSRAGNMKTPMLVVHSQNDFRIPLSQGIELFTALQQQNIKSKWLYFPNEDHWVGKPRNARMWWRTVHGWLDETINKPDAL